MKELQKIRFPLTDFLLIGYYGKYNSSKIVINRSSQWVLCVLPFLVVTYFTLPADTLPMYLVFGVLTALVVISFIQESVKIDILNSTIKRKIKIFRFSISPIRVAVLDDKSHLSIRLVSGTELGAYYKVFLHTNSNRFCVYGTFEENNSVRFAKFISKLMELDLNKFDVVT